MILPSYLVKVAQHACGMEAEGMDGLVGPKTIAAAREYDIECDDFRVPATHAKQLVVTVAQHASGLRGSALDGRLGPVTKERALQYITANDIELARPKKPARRSSWAIWQPHESPGVFEKDGIDLRDGKILTPPGGLDPIPKRSQKNAVFGDAKLLGEDGMKAHMVTIKGLPGRFNTGVGRLPQVHNKIVPHVKLAFELWELFGVLDEIYKIWFFNYRHIRHDSSRPLSYHAWGIACDINPKENFAWFPNRRDKGIKRFSDAWYRKYPRGLSEVAVLCMKKVGFRWGGDWRDYCDPMHFELLRA